MLCICEACGRVGLHGNMANRCVISVLDLDADLLELLLSKLDGASLARACCVCKVWNAAGATDRLWRAAYEGLISETFSRRTAAQLPDMLSGAWSSINSMCSDVLEGFRRIENRFEPPCQAPHPSLLTTMGIAGEGADRSTRPASARDF